MIFTPLMAATLYLFLYGIFILGAIEGLILRFVFRTSLVLSIILMIGANFLSSIAGFFVYVISSEGGQDHTEIIESLTINNVAYWSPSNLPWRFSYYNAY